MGRNCCKHTGVLINQPEKQRAWVRSYDHSLAPIAHCPDRQIAYTQDSAYPKIPLYFYLKRSYSIYSSLNQTHEVIYVEVPSKEHLDRIPGLYETEINPLADKINMLKKTATTLKAVQY